MLSSQVLQKLPSESVNKVSVPLLLLLPHCELLGHGDGDFLARYSILSLIHCIEHLLQDWYGPNN